MRREVGRLLVIFIVLISGHTGLMIITPSVKSDYTLHDPISIEGNEDFAEQAAEEGWPGDGTEEDPYIIETYQISATSANGIEIMSTDAYFIIRDSFISGGFNYYFYYNHGIYLQNVKNGKIINCTIEENYYGIYLNSSYRVNITENRLLENWKNGLHSENSDDNSITNNIFSSYGFGSGVYLESSRRNNITRSSFITSSV